jgi:hypothetical protein
MALKAKPAETGVLVAGIVLAPVALAASVDHAPAAPVALEVPAPVDPVDPVASAVLVRVALVRADLALRVDPVATADPGRRVDPAAVAVLALLGIPRADPVAMGLVAMDTVVARVVRISVLSR